MKAVRLRAAGDTENLVLEDIPEPKVQSPRMMRVRLHAAGINPVDTKLRRSGTYYPDRLPAVLGCDGAGVVDAVGSAVTRFRIGDPVFFFNGGIGAAQGNYAEYTLVDERHAVAKPDNVDFATAAATPLVFLAAWEALFDRAGLIKDQTVLIHAGTGGVGHVAIQLARRAGARVLTTVSDRTKAEYAQQLGADRAVDYRDEDFVRAVLAATGDRGADVVFDTVGGDTLSRSTAVVRVGGTLVTLLKPEAGMDWDTARLRNLRVAFELMLTPMHLGLEGLREHQTEILRCAAEMLQRGELTVRVAQRFPLAQAAQAHQRIEAGGVMGKLVLTID